MHTVPRRLSIFTSEIEAGPQSTAGVRHDAQSALQDRDDHSDVRAVPEQLAVRYVVELLESVALHIQFGFVLIIFLRGHSQK